MGKDSVHVKKQQRLDKKDCSKRNEDLHIKFLQKSVKVGCMEKQAFISWRNHCKILLLLQDLKIGFRHFSFNHQNLSIFIFFP